MIGWASGILVHAQQRGALVFPRETLETLAEQLRQRYPGCVFWLNDEESLCLEGLLPSTIVLSLPHVSDNCTISVGKLDKADCDPDVIEAELSGMSLFDNSLKRPDDYTNKAGPGLTAEDFERVREMLARPAQFPINDSPILVPPCTVCGLASALAFDPSGGWLGLCDKHVPGETE